MLWTISPVPERGGFHDMVGFVDGTACLVRGLDNVRGRMAWQSVKAADLSSVDGALL